MSGVVVSVAWETEHLIGVRVGERSLRSSLGKLKPLPRKSLLESGERWGNEVILELLFTEKVQLWKLIVAILFFFFILCFSSHSQSQEESREQRMWVSKGFGFGKWGWGWNWYWYWSGNLGFPKLIIETSGWCWSKHRYSYWRYAVVHVLDSNNILGGSICLLIANDIWNGLSPDPIKISPLSTIELYNG